MEPNPPGVMKKNNALMLKMDKERERKRTAKGRAGRSKHAGDAKSKAIKKQINGLKQNSL